MERWLLDHRRGIGMAAAGVALAAIGLAWLALSPAVSPAPLRAAPPPPAERAAAPPRDGSESATSTRTDDPPPGATREQWRALREELRSRPDGAAELARIADYLAWSDLVKRLRATTDPAARERLARQVDAGLSARLRNGEISAAEARQVKTAILEATLADPAERAPALRAWIEAETLPAQPDPRQAEFDRRQAEIVAAWSARPQGSRDHAALERDLDTLRREVFAPAPVR